jgi:hypothetical protein
VEFITGATGQIVQFSWVIGSSLLWVPEASPHSTSGPVGVWQGRWLTVWRASSSVELVLDHLSANLDGSSEHIFCIVYEFYILIKIPLNVGIK